MPVQLIALDLDGTLLDQHSQITAENAAAIREAAARGVQFVIVTGRRFDFALPTLAPLACELHVIASNGAVIKRRDGVTLERRLLPVDTARRVLEATTEFRAGQSVIFDRPHGTGRQVILERAEWDHPVRGPYLRRNRSVIDEVSPLHLCLDGEDPIQVGYAGNCANARALEATLRSLPFAPELSILLTEYLARDLSILDVLDSSVSKGTALTGWAKRRGIPRENVMAIGDNWNDREMLAAAGLPVVMGNAVAELKGLGYAVTGRNTESGVAAAIRKFALNE